MFLDELSPLFQELVSKPVAFMGGFASGLLRLNLAEEPVKSWLNQKRDPGDPPPPSSNDDHHSNGSGPQSITIE
ncbi:hypothetical protein [Acaryochloris sp. IP29b_bin.137]|uniref:hypothetical protein n=1 Tax=Acaryochloris sp. IP29b_bin.137 TaxID=2969217 RepID=UPI00261A4DC2|nr:hypothetical protein [Acaryochloris sp. IP29b_bin.137]